MLKFIQIYQYSLKFDKDDLVFQSELSALSLLYSTSGGNFLLW